MSEFKENSSSLPIGIFDSGVGGLTVMQQMIRLLPQEDMIYFGDTARIPYGEKSPHAIIRYSIENSIFLMEHKIKMLVVACNTASAYALEKLQEMFNLPIVGVIEPAVDMLMTLTRSDRVAVIGTRGTIKSGVHQKLIQKKLPNANIKAIACPLLVPLIEESFFNHETTRMIVKEYLKPLKQERLDALLLGCTHYPLLKEMIQEEVGKNVILIDPALTCAEKTKAILNSGKLQSKATRSGKYRFFVSDDPEKFKIAGSEFLGISIQDVKLA